MSKNKDKWISFTNPAYVEENARWEFYQKDQDDLILEIYHNENEEELKELHKTKVMAHIMASMKEEERKEIGNKFIQISGKPAEQIQEDKDKERNPKTKSDSSVYIHQELMDKILKLKIEGVKARDIQKQIKNEYNLSIITVGLYMSQCLDNIRERAKDIATETIKEHLDRYEALYRWFDEKGYGRYALKAMDRKERLLGLQENENELGKMVNGIMLNKEGLSTYNWTRLSESELYRLKELTKRTIKIIKPNKNDEITE